MGLKHPAVIGKGNKQRVGVADVASGGKKAGIAVVNVVTP
jgi:hypothetical protein